MQCTDFVTSAELYMPWKLKIKIHKAKFRLLFDMDMKRSLLTLVEKRVWEQSSDENIWT
jgi:mRNA-degrading endonuclease RelE of RelBE toxin-antitoxin system